MAAQTKTSTTETAQASAAAFAQDVDLRLRTASKKPAETTASRAGTAARCEAERCDDAYKLPAVYYRPLFAPGHPKHTTTINDVPEFLRDTYIISGYRRLCYSYGACLQSMTYVHNESGNVLTHLVSLLLFVCLGVSANFNLLPASMSPGRASWGDYFVLYGYILSACICFALSTLFHAFSCHSHSHHVAWLKCDFVGILVLILGSFLPGLYYGYYESRTLMVVYMAMIFSLFAAGVFVSVSPHLQKPNLRWMRPVVFISISVSGVFPVCHHIFAHGIAASARSIGLYYMLGMCGFYIAGTMLYAFNIPERWFPGLFDIVGNSHQLFHCLVFVAALTHYYGIVQAFKWHHSAQSVI
ncbi:hypothetical protein H4R99_006467 [Coemansia sp. RSA 1722]|nr:hypothetical protein LPJ57_002373 [Coemansia sp. RSA 486]KAJ2230239.1 hypothetical protein IWW45_005866 [Coemansia sp. RSA 485]KAJ2592254.1 hypothetical protein H4R99_006467 [Coemansia sp. RSA 1722]